MDVILDYGEGWKVHVDETSVILEQIEFVDEETNFKKGARKIHQAAYSVEEFFRIKDDVEKALELIESSRVDADDLTTEHSKE